MRPIRPLLAAVTAVVALGLIAPPLAAQAGTTATYYLDSNAIPKAGVTTTQPTGAHTQRTLKKGGDGPNENAPAKYQEWVVGGPLTLEGDSELVIWTRLEDLDEEEGEVRAYLLDCNAGGVNCQLLEDDDEEIEDEDDWKKITLRFKDLDHFIDDNRTLKVRITVDDDSDDDMWFAYDSGAYPSALVVGLDDTPPTTTTTIPTPTTTTPTTTTPSTTPAAPTTTTPPAPTTTTPPAPTTTTPPATTTTTPPAPTTPPATTTPTTTTTTTMLPNIITTPPTTTPATTTPATTTPATTTPAPTTATASTATTATPATATTELVLPETTSTTTPDAEMPSDLADKTNLVVYARAGQAAPAPTRLELTPQEGLMVGFETAVEAMSSQLLLALILGGVGAGLILSITRRIGG